MGAAKTLLCVAGIYVSFIYYGVKIEKNFKKSYDGLYNRFYIFPIILQSLMALVLSMVILACTGKIKWSLLSDPDVKKSSTFIFLGLLISNYSLKHISFLLQMMIKSSKCISAMLLTYLFPLNKGKNLVSRSNIVFGAMITVGIIGFQLSGKPKSSDATSSIYGIIMAFSGALFDSLASRLQMGIRSKWSPSPFEVMFFCSFYTLVFGLFAGVLTGDLKDAMALFMTSREALMDQIEASVLNVMG